MQQHLHNYMLPATAHIQDKILFPVFKAQLGNASKHLYGYNYYEAIICNLTSFFEVFWSSWRFVLLD